MRLHKSQASLEYTIMVGISMVMLLSVSYYFLIHKTGTEKDIIESDIDLLGKEILKNVEEVYFSTGAAKKTIDFSLPEDIDRILVERDSENNSYLVFILVDGTESVFYSRVPVFTFFTGHEAYSGVVTIEKVGDDVIICLTEAGQCHKMDFERNCTDWLDNDLDTKTDGQDWDCCPDDYDGDGYMNEFNTSNGPVYFCNPIPGVWADDCNDTDFKIHPYALEIFDGRDNNCNGEIDEGWYIEYGDYVYDAGGISFFLEGKVMLGRLQASDPARRDGECVSIFDALISVDGDTDEEYNAYIEDAVLGGKDFEYDMCYLPLGGPEKKESVECKLFSDGFCNPNDKGECSPTGGHPGWTKLFGVFDPYCSATSPSPNPAPGGSYAEVYNRTVSQYEYCCRFPNEEYNIVCNYSTSCKLDETCIIALSDNPATKFSPCYDISYPYRICCKIE